MSIIRLFHSLNILTAVTLMLCAFNSMAEDAGSNPATSDIHPSIEHDINALAGVDKESSEATKRLIAQGALVLDQAHKALTSVETNIDHKKRLVIVLGNIANEKSIAPMISVAKSLPDETQLNYIVIASFRAFNKNDEITGFITTVLADKSSDQKLLRAALVYFVKNPSQDARVWAEMYNGPTYDEDLRATALYLGGVLEIKSFKNKIHDALKQNYSNINKDYMLIGLASITSPEEFDLLIKDIKIRKNSIETARHYYYLNRGTEQEQKTAATQIINTGHHYLMLEAINYFINKNDPEPLAQLWLNNNKAVRFAVARAGLIIAVDHKGTRFEIATGSAKPEEHFISYSAENLDIDEFVRSIFLTLKNKDRDTFKSRYLLSDDDIARYIVLMAPAMRPGGESPDTLKEQFIKQRESILSSWDKIYQIGVRLNLDWPEVHYVATTYSKSGYSSAPSFLIGYKGNYHKIRLPDQDRKLINGKLKLSDQLIWGGNKLDSSALHYWAELSKNNNNLLAAKELTILAKGKNGKIEILRMLSSYDDPVAQYDLYSQLIVSTKQAEKNEAIQWLSKSAANNYPQSQYELGEFYLNKHNDKRASNDSGANTDLLKSKKQLELAATNNYLLALEKLAFNYTSGSNGYDIDYIKAIQYYESILSLDPDTMTTNDKHYYLTGGFKKKIEELKATKSNLEKSDPETLARIALQQLESGAITNKTKAMRMLESAAQQGHAEAQYQLGSIFANGSHQTPKNIDKTVEWWEKAAKQKQATAMEALTYGYMYGKYGIQIDLDKAVSLSEQLIKYYASFPNHLGHVDSVTTWRVNMCNTLDDIQRKKVGDSYVTPRPEDKSRHCRGI